MDFDLKAGTGTWSEAAQLARQAHSLGFSGLLFTEASQTPWMSIAAAAMAAPELTFSTGIAVAFPRSPMISAQVAWELAGNTQGRFRLGLGSQIRTHVTRRYGSVFDKPAPQLKDYILAVRACLAAFQGDEPLNYEGRYYQLTFLNQDWTPPMHEFGRDIKIDISAVGPYMCRVAGEVADGVHVHPMHSMDYVHRHLLPKVGEGLHKAGRSMDDVDLIFPVLAAPGNSPEERSKYVALARRQIAFYGSTPNYGFQFEDLGFDGLSQALRERLKAGDIDGMCAMVEDDLLEHFAVVAKWDDLADQLIARYRGLASRIVMYFGRQSLLEDPQNAGRWQEVAQAVRAA